MSTSIIAQLKKKKKEHTHATIIIRGYYSRQPVASVSTGQVIQVEHWDPVKRLLKPSAPSAILINTLIQTKLQHMKNELLKKEIMGGKVNRQQVIKAVRQIDDSKDFYRFCWQQISLYESSETKRTYNTEVTKMQQFAPTLSFADIDYGFLTRYKKYMQVKLQNQPNTIWKSFKFLNTMINRAVKCGGIIDENPFAEFNRGKYEQNKRTWLEISDCDKIENNLHLITDEFTRKVAIYFLLMAYSGMRFTDAMRFDPAVHVEDGWLTMQYQKFGTTVHNKIWDRLSRVVEQIKNNRISTTNKTFNLHLKTVAGICGIDMKIRAHMARHTMGGILAEKGIPVEHAQLILGHKDIKSTWIYYHVKKKNVEVAMDMLNGM